MPYDTYRRSLSRALAALLPEGAEISDSVLLKAFATFSMIKARSPSDMAADYQKIVSGAGLDAVTDYVALRGLSADGRLFAEAHELFTGLSHDRFLRFAVPDFACNPVAAIYIIERYTPGTRDTVFHILAVKHVADIAQNGPAPRKRELKAQLWSIYTSEFPSNGTTLKRDDFLELYQAINYYPLSVQESSINNTAMKAVTAWKNIGEPVERQLEYAALFYLENQQPGELEQRYLAAGEDGGSEKRRAVFTDALKILGRVYPVDFLCAAVFNEKYNDIALENGLVYTQFTSGLFPESEGCRVLIYSPTPFFIRKWLLDPALRTVDTTFLVEDTSSRDLLRYNYQSKEYGTGVNNNVTFEVKDKWEKRIREEGRLDCSLILYFATHSPAGQQDESIRLWKRYADKELAFCLLAGTGELEDASSPLSRELYDTRIKIDAICLLPQGINRSTIPRRKLLIRCTMEPRDAVSGGTAADGDYITELLSFPLNTDWQKQLLTLQIRAPVQVRKNDLQALNTSIRDLYRTEFLKRKSKGGRKDEPVPYTFTPEITIWFSRSYPENNKGRPRLDAYICYPPDPGKTRRGYLERGRQIKAAIKRTTRIPESRIIHWLEYEYPFASVSERRAKRPGAGTKGIAPDDSIAGGTGGEPISGHRPVLSRSIRDEIIAVYGPIYENKPISLKLLWYLYPSLQDAYSGDDYFILSNMVRTGLGMLMLSAETPVQAFEDGMEKAYPDAPQKDIRLMWMLLSQAFDFAAARGHCDFNILREAADSASRERDLFAEVRGALTKKSFTITETKKIYRALQEKIEAEGKSEYLGVLIRLLTGLESNIVCGLKWDDFRYIPDFQFYQLWVRGQVTNDGSAFVGFTRREDYRRYPCPATLARYLLAQKDMISEALSGKDMLQLPIVTTKETFDDPAARYSVLPPRKLEQISREVIRYAEITDQVIMVPDSKQGTKESNLAHYQGDIFRSNLRYHLLENAKMADGELMYLLGNRQHTTFNRYYCDFLNDAAQLTMLVKLNRWDACLTAPEHYYTVRQELYGIRNYEKSIELQCAYPQKLDVELRLPHKGGEALITAESLYGLDCTAGQLCELEPGEDE